MTWRLIDGQKVYLSGVKLAFFSELFNARGWIVSIGRMREAAYGSREDGNPSNACIMVTICQLRARLMKTRFRIVNYRDRGWAFRRLVVGQ